LILIEIYFLKRCAGVIPAYRLTDNAAQDGYESEAQFLFSATLAQTFNNRSSRLDWCGNYCPIPRRTFHSSRRSGGIYSLLFIVF
jgi:hypothetical protein